MYKTLCFAALAGMIGFAHPVLAQSPSPTIDVMSSTVDFSHPAPVSDTVLVPNHNAVILGSLTAPKAKDVPHQLASPDRAVTVYQAQVAPLTDVKDAAARPAFWGPTDMIVLVFAALAALFMRLLLVRQRHIGFADGIRVETVR